MSEQAWGVRASLTLAALWSLACGGLGSLPPDQPPTPSPEPTILALQRGTGGCSWSVHQLVSDASETLHQTPECPEFIVWETQQRSTIYNQDAVVYRYDWETGEVETVAADSPLDTPFTSDLVVSAETGKLRVSRLVPLPAEAVIPTQFGTSYRFEDEVWPAYEMEERHGQPAMAEVLEHHWDGWKRVVIAPTRTGDSLSPGLTPVSDAMASRQDSPSWRGALDFVGCGSETCGGPALAFSPRGQQQLNRFLPMNAESKAIQVGPSRSVVGVRVSPASDHLEGPAVFCWQRCGRVTPIHRLPMGPLHVSAQGEHVLITVAGTQSWPQVYEFGSPEPVMSIPDASAAGWLPFDRLGASGPVP